MKYSSIISRIFIYMAIAFVCISCQKDVTSEEGLSDEIIFSGTVENAIEPDCKSADVKGSHNISLTNENQDRQFFLSKTVSTNWEQINGESQIETRGSRISNLDNLTFGLYAYAQDHSQYIKNHKYYRRSIASSLKIFAPSTPMKWPEEVTPLNFYAIGPYDESNLGITSEVNWEGCFSYKVPEDFKNQKDLIFAIKRNVKKSDTDYPNLSFRHCLAAICFNTANDIPACKIKRISLIGIQPGISVLWKTGNEFTISTYGDYTNFTYTPDLPINVNSGEIINLTGIYKAFLVPGQTFTTDQAKIEIVFDFDGDEQTLSASIKDGAQDEVWNPGYIYTYTVSANPVTDKLIYSRGDSQDEIIFKDLVLPANHIGGGIAPRPSDPTFTGYTFTGWKDQDGNDWDFSKPVSGFITIHPTWTKNTDYTLMSGVENENFHPGKTFTKELHSFMTANSATEVIFGNWTDYCSTIGGTFSNGTFAGETKYDDVRMFANSGKVYVISKDSQPLYAHSDCTNLFNEDKLAGNKLTKLNIKYLNTSRVTKMAKMFYYCGNLTRILVDSNWSTGAVNDNGNDMFGYCTSLCGDWSTKVSDTSKEFARKDYFNEFETYISGSGSNKRTNYKCRAGGYLSTTDKTHYAVDFTPMHEWFAAALGKGATKLYIGNYNTYKDLCPTDWDTNTDVMKGGYGFGYSNYYFNTDYKGNHHVADFFAEGKQEALILAEGDGIIVPIQKWTNFLNYAPDLYTSGSNMTSVEIQSFDTRYLTSVTNFFLGNFSLQSVSMLGDMDFSNVEKIIGEPALQGMDGMFANCKGLEIINLTGIHDFSKITSTENMFLNAETVHTIYVRSSELDNWKNIVPESIKDKFVGIP